MNVTYFGELATQTAPRSSAMSNAYICLNEQDLGNTGAG